MSLPEVSSIFYSPVKGFFFSIWHVFPPSNRRFEEQRMWFTIKTVKPTGGNVIVILGYINEIDLIDLMRPELESIYLLKEELKKKKN